ncbi:SurA N-terminal domain-containing protein [Myxococcota bacterium]|nr:SurA N-terminal domain-containing protein [Myxococcota bacterium]
MFPRRLARALLTFAFGLTLIVGPAGAVVVDRVAAVVNKEVITLSDVYELGGEFIAERVDAEGEQARREAEMEVLDTLIQTELVSQEMSRLGLDVTQDDLEATIDDIARQNGLTRDQLRREVERSGLAWSLYREQLMEQLRSMRFGQSILAPRVTVAEQDLRDLYDREIKDGYVGAESRVLEGILVPWGADASPEARAALALKLSEDKARHDAGTVTWAELLAEHPESLLAGGKGQLGAFLKGEAIPELDAAAFGAPVGAVSGPIALPNGLMLLRVSSSEFAPPPPYEALREQLSQELQARKMESEMALWTAQARRQAAVVVKLEPPVGYGVLDRQATPEVDPLAPPPFLTP